MSRNKKIEKINDEAVEFNRQRTIKEGLSEIYQDDDGEIIDVKKLQIKPRKGWRWWLGSFLVYLFIIALLATAIFYWFRGGVDPTAVQLSLEAPKSLVAGVEFEYKLKYKNQNKSALKNISLKMEYPQNFIFSDSQPALPENQKEWKIDQLEAGAEGEIVVRGKIINEIGKSNVAVAEMYYSLDNFSSEYKKVATLDSSVESIGLETVLVSDGSALVGEAQKMVLKYKLKEGGSLNHFWLTVEPSDISQVEFISDTSQNAGVKLVKPWVWEVSDVDGAEKEVKINFKFIDKVKDKYAFLIKLEAREFLPVSMEPSGLETVASSTTATSSDSLNLPATQEQDYLFHQETTEIQVINNELNLILVANGSDQDQGVNFGQTLNYSLSYANSGSRPIENAVIMAIVEGNIIDWTSLKDKYKAKVNDKAIVWTENEIPELARLAPGDEGIIDFSLKIKDFDKLKGKSFDQQIKSYAKFTAKQEADIDGASAEIKEDENNKSNIIVGKLNSDLLFKESLLYFNDDNVPLGNGPIPFAVGQRTVVRGSWSMLSSLHDLHDVEISLKLPDYVDWADKSNASAGDLSYDQTSRTITWRLSQLNVGQTEIKADFDLAVQPTEAQRRQLLVIMPKAKISAIDSVTDSQLNKEGKIKTSKLEDDIIIGSGDLDNNNGLVK